MVRFLRCVIVPSILIATAIFGLTLTPGRFQTGGSPASFTLIGRITSPTGWGLTPSTVTSPGPDLTVTAGETVTMSLSSGDSTHNWGVDYNGNGVSDPGEPLSSNFGSTATPFTFTVEPTRTPGTYTYWCFIHHGPMFGKFIVQSPPPTPDFTVSANPLTVGPIGTGAQGRSTITVTSVNGFMGNVTLSTSASAGLTATVSPTSVTGGSGQATMTVNASASGTYVVNVTGTSPPLSHSVTVTVYVGSDFTISANLASLSIVQGSSSNYNVTLQSLNGFSGSLSLTAAAIPNGPSATLNPLTLTLSSGTSAQSIVLVSTSAGVYSTATGSYTLKVTGTNGTISHSVDVAITVTSANPAGLPTSILAGAVIGVVATAAVAIFLVRREKHKK